MMRRRLLLATAVLSLVPAASAQAHAELRQASPSPHEALDAAPGAITLTFSEAVQAPAGALRVTGPDGRPVTGRLQQSGPTVSVLLRRRLRAGKYAVRWRVVSDDGHVVGGAYRFKLRAGAAVGHAAPARTPAPAAASHRVGLGTIVIIAALGAALTALLGGFAVRRRGRPDTPATWTGRGARRLAIADLVLLGLGACCALPLFVVALLNHA